MALSANDSTSYVDNRCKQTVSSTIGLLSLSDSYADVIITIALYRVLSTDFHNLGHI